MVSRASLASAYLVATGVGLVALVASGLVVPESAITARSGITVPFGAFNVIALASAFTATGVWLGRSDLADESVWKVAQWGVVGLGVPTLVTVLFASVHRHALVGVGWRTVAVNNVAAGGIVGVLIGAVVELRRTKERSARLNQRNAVFNRVLRHDIRNSMNLVAGYLDRIERGEDVDRSVEVVRDQVENVVRLSRAARRLDELDADGTFRPVDLAPLVEERIDATTDRYPDVTVETDLADARVRANDRLGAVVDNLLVNAVEHNDGEPLAHVAIDPPAAGEDRAELRVRDDGPGLPAAELDVHANASETDLEHSDGIGLWLSKWIVETYDGELVIENLDDGGARVTVRLPTVRP